MIWYLLVASCYGLLWWLHCIFSLIPIWGELAGSGFFAVLFIYIWRLNSQTSNEGMLVSEIFIELQRVYRQSGANLWKAWKIKEGDVYPLRLALFWLGVAFILFVATIVPLWEVLFNRAGTPDWLKTILSVSFVIFLALTFFAKKNREVFPKT